MIFSVSDNMDGSGATATISGSGGASNSVYYSLFSGSLVWVLAGAITGDGTVAIPAPIGVYTSYLLSNAIVVPPVAFTVTDAATLAIETRCRSAVMAVVGALPIPPAGNLYVQKWPIQSMIDFPCMLFTVDGVQETDESQLSTVDDVGYPVRIAIADRSDKQDSTMLPQYELWRQNVANCFRNQRLPGVPESVKCKVEPYVIIDPEGKDYAHIVMGLTIRCICRQQRGFGR